MRVYMDCMILTMQEARTMQITKVTKNLMAELGRVLDEVKDNIMTNRAYIYPCIAQNCFST